MGAREFLGRSLDRLFGLVTGNGETAPGCDSPYCIYSISAPPPLGPYSQAIARNGLVFCSGQIGIDALSGELVDGGIQAETNQVLYNLQAILKKANSNLSEITQTTVYLADLEDYDEFNLVYSGYFLKNPPSRAAVQVARLPKNARVEISCIAFGERLE